MDCRGEDMEMEMDRVKKWSIRKKLIVVRKGSHYQV